MLVREVKEPPKFKYKAKPRLLFDKNGSNLSPTYSPAKEVINTAIGLGYEEQDVHDELIKFRFYYTEGKGKSLKISNWDYKFVQEWLVSAYRMGNLKRNGRFYRNTRERDLADIFADVTD